MREGISIEVNAADREQLAAVVVDRNRPQKHVWRAPIILATAEGCGTAEIMRRAGVSKPCVALAGAFHAPGGRRLAARQDAKTRSAATAVGAGRPRGRTDIGRSRRGRRHTGPAG